MNLVADIDGTRIRLALADARGHLSQPFLAATPAQLAPLLRAWLLRIGAPALRGFACAVAPSLDAGGGRRGGDHDLHLGPEDLLAASAAPRAWLMRDVEALAHALPALAADDLQACSGAAPDVQAPRVVLLPGDTLGMARVVGTPGGWQIEAGEIGQAAVEPTEPREGSVWTLLASDGGQLTAASLLSRGGLLRIYRALLRLSAPDADGSDAPADIAAAAAAGDRIAAESLRLLARWLGRVAAGLALRADARGGVFVGGGLVSDAGGWFDRAAFGAGFAMHASRHAPAQALPCYVVQDPQAMLRGLARVASDTGPVPSAIAS
jgi:glucokinase